MWLKTFGEDVLKGLEIVAGVAPLFAIANSKLAPVAATVTSDLEQIIATIQQVEVIGQQAGQTGAQKLAAATPIVKQQVLAFLQQRGYSVQDQNRFDAAVTGLTSVTADILNTVQQIKSA